jgi:outer membrane protein
MNVKAFVLGSFLLAGMSGSYASPGQNGDNLRLLGDASMLRLQMETHQGSVTSVQLGAQQRSLLVDFGGVDADALASSIKDWAERNPMIQGARIQTQGKGIQLVLDFKGPVTLLDETVVALGQDRTRMEVVLGKVVEAKGMALLGPDQSAPVLHELTISRKGDMVELALAGDASLVAEVFFQDKPPAFMVDLPGVTPDLLQQKIDDLGRGGLPELVNGVQVGKGPGGVARLQLNLAEPADLVNSSGILRQDNSILRMQLVADRARVGGQQRKVALKNMSLERNRGRMAFVLQGTEGTQVKAYALDQPPRLMLDFLGWEPDQVLDALSRFNRQQNPGVAAVHYGESRLGSARVELELVAGVQVADAVVRSEKAADSENVLIALDAPGLSHVLAGVAITGVERLSGLDLRYSPAHDFSTEPTKVILPLTLSESEKWAKAIGPVVGTEFDLLSLYVRALDNDSKYLAAKAGFSAASEAVPQARAGYLPVAAFDYKYASINQDVQQAANPSFPTGSSGYKSRTWALTITQPVFKVSAMVKMRQAKVSVEQAQVNLLTAEQDLMMRVSENYLNLLAAKDGLELAQAERESMSKQLELARTSSNSGRGNFTDLSDAEARYALAQTKEITELNAMDIARMTLKEFIGEDVSNVRGFKADFAAVVPQPAKIGPWVEAARSQNLALQSRNLASEIAKLEIERLRSGHYPSLELVGSRERNDTGGSLYGDAQLVDNSQVMLQLNMPLYSGGMTSSVVREAVARWQQTEYLRDEELRRTESLARAAFIGVLTSSESLSALRKMVNAQERALSGRLDGFKAGLYDIVDVLDGYRLYYAARRDYLKTRYTYLVNRLKLKQAVGTLSRNDLDDLAQMFE